MTQADRLQYFLKRLVYSVFVVLAVTVLAFMLMHLAPGNPVDLLLARSRASDELRKQIMAQYHLNEPWYMQYLLWLWDIIHLNLGTSITKSRPVATLFAERWVVSAQIIVMSMFFAVLFSIPTGIFVGYKHGTKLDKTVTILAVLGVSMPVFVTSVLAILLFSYYFQILPSIGAGAGFFARIPSLLAPSILLALWIGSLMFRMMRAGMRDVLEKDYIQMSVAMGIPTRKRIVKHAAKNALAPVMTISALWAGSLIVSTMVVEYVFGIGGLGRLIIDSVISNDFPVVLAGTIITAVAFVVLNLLVDILYTWIDPRVSLGEQ